MRKVSIIGIGAGDPEHVTVQAVKALNAADVFFVVTKSSEQQELVDLRTHIIERYVDGGDHRIVTIDDPDRRRGTDAHDHQDAVAQWRAQRAEQYATVLREELREDERGAFLAWGDPALYESTLTILRDLGVDVDVVPGISSVAALAAAHRIPLNRVGGAVQITTGRRLQDHGMPDGVDDLVVMLDPHQAFTAHPDLDIYWGAYLATADEILVAGRVAHVADQIERVRAQAKQRKGWVFDTYLLRRP